MIRVYTIFGSVCCTNARMCKFVLMPIDDANCSNFRGLVASKELLYIAIDLSINGTYSFHVHYEVL